MDKYNGIDLNDIKANPDNDLKIRNTINTCKDSSEKPLSESANDSETIEYFTE